MKRVTIQGRRVANMAGVTLIELMVVVVIVAILVSIAVPMYRSHVVKTNRRAAQSCLSEAAQFMERYYTTNLTYVGATPNPGCTSDAGLSARYAFSTSNLGQSTYTLVATPRGPQNDAQCGAMSLTQNGTRSPATSGCW